MEKFLIVSHVVSGSSVLLLGFIQMLNRKGGKSHIVLGKIYVGAMWWICFSALAIITWYRFSAFLMVIAVLTFHSSFVGVRMLKRKKTKDVRWYDWMTNIITMCFGVGLVGYAVFVYINHPGSMVFIFLCSLFGTFTFFNSYKDLKFLTKKEEKSKRWRIKQHVSAMGGSYIAAVTAFTIQNPDIFIPYPTHQWLLWVLPSAIGSPIIARVLTRMDKQSVSFVKTAEK